LLYPASFIEAPTCGLFPGLYPCSWKMCWIYY